MLMNSTVTKTRNSLRGIAAITLGALFLPLLGCGAGTKNPIVPVEGKIALADGKKLPTGTRVLLNPTEGRVGTAVGATAEDGSFQVQHVSGSMGAEEGKYMVKLLPPELGSAEFEKAVPKKYQEEPFTVAEIKPGMPPLDFKVPVGR
jgi:hypothetical protein